MTAIYVDLYVSEDDKDVLVGSINITKCSTDNDILTYVIEDISYNIAANIHEYKRLMNGM